MALCMLNRVSNIGCKVELGRFPLAIPDILSVLKYYSRLNNDPIGSLLNNALESQRLAKSNSNRTMTFTDIYKSSEIFICK